VYRSAGSSQSDSRWEEHFEEVLNQPEPLLTAYFGDTVMADSFEVYTRDTSVLKKSNMQSIV